MNTLALTIAAAMLTAAFAAGAAPGASGVDTASRAGVIYEWVDDSGLRHASDAVPEKYRGVARRVDPSSFQIPASEQEAAERQAAALKAKAASAAPPPRPADSANRPGPAKATSLSGRQPAPDTPECAAWRRQVAANRECFIGYSNPNGTMGLHSCSNEPDPEPACEPDSSR